MDKQYIIEKDGKKRPAEKVICHNCGKEFLKASRLITRTEARGQNHHCSKKCSQKNQVSKIEVKCAYCNESVFRTPSQLTKSKSGLYFCNKTCKTSAQQVFGNTKTISEILPAHYGAGTSNYRQLALREHGEVCNRCGYNKLTACLQVHHKDHDHANNDIDNLEVLCANCHTEEHYNKED